MTEKATPEDIAKRLGFSSSDVSSFMSGKVVAIEHEASSDKDLSLAVAAKIGASMEKAWDFVVAERIHEIQESTLTTGKIDTATMSVAAMDLDEDTVKALLKSNFLSKAEHSRLKDGHKHHKGAAVYKEILTERAKAYWEKGLPGIVPYDGKGRSPADDLKHANAAALKMLKDPTMIAELQVVPSKSSHPEMHSLAWAICKGNEQAAPVLNHLIRFNRGDGFINVTRRFYSGIDYDSSQILAGAVPIPDGSIVFYTNHTYTSSVAGFGGSAKRSIGRKMMKGKLIATMEKAQKTLHS